MATMESFGFKQMAAMDGAKESNMPHHHLQLMVRLLDLHSPLFSLLLLHLTFWKMVVISSLAVLLHLFYLFETLQAKYVEAVGSKQQVTGVGDQQAINSSSNSEKALLYESNELRKRGLCLVPISMLINYLG